MSTDVHAVLLSTCLHYDAHHALPSRRNVLYRAKDGQMAHIQVDPNDDIKLYIITKTKGHFQQVMYKLGIIFWLSNSHAICLYHATCIHCSVRLKNNYVQACECKLMI